MYTPHVGLLDSYSGADRAEMDRKATETAGKINAMFSSFGIRASVDEVKTGQTINTYMVRLAPGVSVSKVKNALANLAYIVGNANIRLSAPIEGDPRIGIEIPNGNSDPVCLRSFGGQWAGKSPVSFALGRGKDGDVVCDIAEMPHLLIAGATGSGKSVCINSIITSVIYRTHPLAARLVLIDPKKVELAPYDGDPHLICPVVTDAMEAVTTLYGLCGMMDERFTVFASNGCRSLEEYNAKHPHEKYPHVVCVVDELADLMLVSRKEAEMPIVRLAQLGRAAGIHLVIATQRPTRDVITGLIKANMPSRIAFAVASGTDSRVILDMNGAEKLQGKGDMLYKPADSISPIRLQGVYVSPGEIERITSFVRESWAAENPTKAPEQTTTQAPQTPAQTAPQDIPQGPQEPIKIKLRRKPGFFSRMFGVSA